MARLFATTGTSFARLDETANGWTVEPSLPDSTAQCLALDPNDPDTVYVGLGAGGLRKTTDGARTWVDVGLADQQVFSVAVSAVDGAVYAGTEPSALFRSDDDGATGASSPACSTSRLARPGVFRRALGHRIALDRAEPHAADTTLSASSSVG